MNSPASFPMSYLEPVAQAQLQTNSVRQPRRVPAKAGLLSAWRLICARKRLVLGTALLLTLISAILILSITPLYRASTTLLIEPGANNVVSIEDVYGVKTDTNEHFQTQAEALLSNDVGLRTVRQLKLIDNRQFDLRQQSAGMLAGLITPVSNLMGGLVDFASDTFGTTQRAASGQQASGLLWPVDWLLLRASDTFATRKGEYSVYDLEQNALRALHDGLRIEPARLSQLIRIKFDSSDPQLAAEVTNALATSFIRSDLDARFEIQQTAKKWLAQQLDQFKGNLEKSERQLQAYREEVGLLNADTDGANGGREMVATSDGLVQARADRSRIEQIYRQVSTRSLGRYQVPAVFNNSTVAASRKAEGVAKRRVAELAERLGSAHPAYKRAATEYAAARANTRQQADAVIASVKKQYQAAVGNERALEANMAASRKKAQQSNRKELPLVSLQREVNTNRQIYKTFLTRMKEADALSNYEKPVARVVDPALTPVAPFSPKVGPLLWLALLSSLITGAVLALLLERHKAQIRSSDDVEDKLGAPLLAAVPHVHKLDRMNLTSLQSMDSMSVFTEAVRNAATSIKLQTFDNASTTVQFTSTVPGEGKSTLAICLALEEARSRRVLLIDADLRRPTIAKRLGLKDDGLGLVDLCLEADPRECVRRVPGLDLYVLTSGKVPGNAVDVLHSARFRRTMEHVRKKFDLIVVDSPPIELVSDALLIGRECDGVVYVTKANDTPVPMVQRGLAKLERASIPLLGVMLNDHDFERAGRYYGDTAAQTRYSYG